MLESDLIPRIATPFGAGLGQAGMLCGAVAGTVMALGILKGRDEGGGETRDVYGDTRTLVEEFRSHFGSLDCRVLTGIDLSSKVQRKIFVARDLKEKRCRGYMEWSLERLEAFLAQVR